jgi:hypothetical protein
MPDDLKALWMSVKIDHMPSEMLQGLHVSAASGQKTKRHAPLLVEGEHVGEVEAVVVEVCKAQ